MLIGFFGFDRGHDMGEIVKDIVFSISLFIVLFLIWITLIQYLIKRNKESNITKDTADGEVEIKQQKKGVKISVISACLLSVLVLVGMLLDENIGRDSSLVTIVMVLFYILLFGLALLVRNLK